MSAKIPFAKAASDFNHMGTKGILLTTTRRGQAKTARAALAKAVFASQPTRLSLGYAAGDSYPE